MPNKWLVYEFLKHRFMATGIVPATSEVEVEFSLELAPDEISEGIIEFKLTIGKGA